MINKKSHLYGIMNNLVSLIAPMAILPFVINQVGLDKYGAFVQENIIYALTTAIFFTSLTGYFIKEFVRDESNIRTIFALQIIFSLISGCVFCIYLFSVSSHTGTLFFLIAILSNALNFEWFYHARAMQKELFYRTLIIRVLFLLAVLLLVPIYRDVQSYVFIYASSVVASNVMAFAIIFKYIKRGVVFKNTSISNEILKIKKAIWDAKYFMLTPAIGSIYQYGDQLLVGVMFGNAQLVFINLAKQIIGASVMVSGTLCRVEQKNVMTLEGCERVKKIKKIFYYYSFYLLASFVSINLFLPFILHFLVNDSKTLSFWYYALISLIFVVTSISIFIDYVVGVSYRRELLTLKSNVICAIVVMALNILLLRHFGAYFSLVSLAIGEIIVATLLFFFHRKTFVSENKVI